MNPLSTTDPSDYFDPPANPDRQIRAYASTSERALSSSKTADPDHDDQVHTSVIRRALSSLKTTQDRLDKVHRLRQTCSNQHSPMTIESGLARIDPLCTQRQRSLAWYKKHFGIIGLSYYIGAIAKWEAKDERTDPHRLDSPHLENAHDAAYEPSTDPEDESQSIEEEEDQDDEIYPDSDIEPVADSNARSRSS